MSIVQSWPTPPFDPTRSVFDHLDLSKVASARPVESTFEIIKKTLESAEDLLIIGFGKFWVKEKGKR